MRLSSVGWVVVLCALGCAVLVAPPAQGFEKGFSRELLCANNKMSAELLAKYTTLPGPSNGASVLEGTPVTFSGESSQALTFRVTSSPALLSSPDIDSGPGSLQPGTQLYSFTSTKAAATPRTIYWTASFTVTLEGCEGPSTFMAPVRSLTVVSPTPKEERPAVTKTQEAPAAKGASVNLEKVKVTASSLVITITTSQAGTVTITGPGLRKTVKSIPVGTDRVAVPLTKAGKAERKQRKKIKLAVSLRTTNVTVSRSEKIKL